MKKILAVLVVFSCLAYLSVPALAGVNNGAKKYNWNLSGNVMPVPPYGSMDIPGSDTSSKLIVNEPNGKVKANVTGVMNGLTPNTTYTVYLSNTYEKYVETGWNVTGNYGINVKYEGTDYPEELALTQTVSGITGTLQLVGGGSLWTIDSGTVNSNSLELFGHFNANPTLKIKLLATIAPDGTFSGTWMDIEGGSRSGTWNSTSGMATMSYTGNNYWTGQLPGTQPFTFTTDSLGSGSWHYNFKNTAPTSFSVWINGAGGTILISNPITLSN